MPNDQALFIVGVALALLGAVMILLARWFGTQPDERTCGEFWTIGTVTTFVGLAAVCTAAVARVW